MSWQASEHVRRLRNVTASEKAILYSLADRHNTGDGGCWPRVALIAEEAGLSVRATQDNLRRLVEKGVIQISRRKREDGSQASNFYAFVGLEAEDAPTNKRSNAEVNRGRQMPQGVVQQTTPLEPINESLREKKISEVYEQVFSKLDGDIPLATEVINANRYFMEDVAANFDPRNIVAVIRVANEVRGNGPDKMVIPLPSTWHHLDAIGAFLRKENGKLDRDALYWGFEAAFDKAKLHATPGWANILYGVVTHPDSFFEAYDEARNATEEPFL